MATNKICELGLKDNLTKAAADTPNNQTVTLYEDAKEMGDLINAAKELVYFEFKFPVVRRRNPGIFSLT